MAVQNTFGGYPFDAEVFASYSAMEPTFSDNVIASGIVVKDDSINDILGEKGTIATIPMYKPLDPDEEGNEPKERNGTNNNDPTETKGVKQTCVRQDVMKAWSDKQLTRELTGANPVGNVAANVEGYWRMVRQSRLLGETKAVLGVAGLANHTYEVKDAFTAGTIIDAAQKALGDNAGKLGLIVLHSRVAAEYKKLGLMEFRKYTIPGALEREVELPTIMGMIALENDRGTFDGTNYNTYMYGEGAFSTASPVVLTPDYVEYDPKAAGGTDVLYCNRSWVIHPNGMSFKVSGMAGATPTKVELENSANWELANTEKDVRIGCIKVAKTVLDPVMGP